MKIGAFMLNFEIFHNDTRKSIIIPSKFGDLQINEDKAIKMPIGIIGVPNTNILALSVCPIPKLSQCFVLQSLQDRDTSFLIFPISIHNPPLYSSAELQNASLSIGISIQNVAIATILCKNQDGSITANLRAPLFFDTHDCVGAQFVMPNNKIPTSYPLDFLHNCYS